jgi:hypothetical protein
MLVRRTLQVAVAKFGTASHDENHSLITPE